jgi:hypothetical protein
MSKQKSQNVVSHFTAAARSRDSSVTLQREVTVYSQLGREHAALLSQRNWTDKDTDQLEAAGAAVDRTRQARSAQRKRAIQATAAVYAAVDEGLALRMELQAGLKLLESRGFRVGPRSLAGKVDRSPARLLMWLDLAREDVAEFEAELAHHVPTPLWRLDGVRQRLLATLARRERAYRKLPGLTASLHDARARAVDLIERLRLTARAATVRNAALWHEFRRAHVWRMARSTVAAANDDAASAASQRVA